MRVHYIALYDRHLQLSVGGGHQQTTFPQMYAKRAQATFQFFKVTYVLVHDSGKQS